MYLGVMITSGQVDALSKLIESLTTPEQAANAVDLVRRLGLPHESPVWGKTMATLRRVTVSSTP